MSNLILPHSITKNLPFSVTAQLASLPEEAQREFFDEYNLKSRSLVLSYVLQTWVFGTQYLYLGKWGLQLLYWLSWAFFGLGSVWWFIDLFRMPGMVNEYNSKLADDILKNVLLKYKVYGKKEKIKFKEVPNPVAGNQKRAPRNIESNYDPSNITIENLKMGYILDYDIQTWEVTHEWQYDWENNTTEKEFKLMSNADPLFLTICKEARQLTVKIGKQINIFAIDEHIESEIINKGRPYNILKFENITYYRDAQFDGISYFVSEPNSGTRVVAWDYYDGVRENHLRIIQKGRGDFKVTQNKMVSPYEFTDILPKE